MMSSANGENTTHWGPLSTVWRIGCFLLPNLMPNLMPNLSNVCDIPTLLNPYRIPSDIRIFAELNQPEVWWGRSDVFCAIKEI